MVVARCSLHSLTSLSFLMLFGAGLRDLLRGSQPRCWVSSHAGYNLTGTHHPDGIPWTGTLPMATGTVRKQLLLEPGLERTLEPDKSGCRRYSEYFCSGERFSICLCVPR